MNDPFYGISELQKNKLFKILETHIYDFSQNQEILPTLKYENIICVLLEGSANIISINYNGDENLIESLEENSVFGTYISGTNDPGIEIRACENCRVLIIDYSKLTDSKNVTHNYYNIFINNLFKIVSLKLKEKNDRIKILTKKTIRDKILAYFESEYKRSRSKFIYLPSNFKDLADYLSINRSAMFRELRDLKDENFIKVDGKRITLLYTPEV